MLQNAYFLAKTGADTAENEQHFAEIFVGLYLPRSTRFRAFLIPAKQSVISTNLKR
jgi:hypothetical protein